MCEEEESRVGIAEEVPDAEEGDEEGGYEPGEGKSGGLWEGDEGLVGEENEEGE